MKSWLIVFVLLCHTCVAQKWMMEISAGGAVYNGDLSQNPFSFSRLRPHAGISFKYDSRDLVNFRTGITWAMLNGDDKDNNESLAPRNLNFSTHLFEFHSAAEFNFFDPEIYTSYPYAFAGLGLFYYKPYSFDNDNKKVFLQPLSTEGQGLEEYPSRKPYSLVQACVPFGFGWKWVTKKNSQVIFEFGYRLCFTDYLDDVSKTYVDPEVLSVKKGPKSGEMSYRKINTPFTELGEPRGNPENKDLYYFAGIKYSFFLKNKKPTEKNIEEEKPDTLKKKKQKKRK